MKIFQKVFKLQSGHESAKKITKGEIIQKVQLQELPFLYATHRHDLFYITVKYHENIPKGIQDIERTRKCLRTDGRTADGRTDGRMDARLIAISPEPFGRGKKGTVKENAREHSVPQQTAGAYVNLKRNSQRKCHRAYCTATDSWCLREPKTEQSKKMPESILNHNRQLVLT